MSISSSRAARTDARYRRSQIETDHLGAEHFNEVQSSAHIEERRFQSIERTLNTGQVVPGLVFGEAMF